MRIPALVLSIFVVAATSASADSVFSSDFEQGDVCGWSATAGACWSGDAMAQSLVQLGTYAVCVPPTTVTYVVPVLGTLSVELCGQSQCASGAPGCDATAHVTSATYDAQTGRADLTGSLDDAVFPVQVNFLGTTEDDSLSVSAADGTGTIDDQELPTCFSDIWQVSDVPGAQLDLAATLAFSGGPLATYANTFLSFFQGPILSQIDALAAESIREQAASLYVGRWVCLPN